MDIDGLRNLPDEELNMDYKKLSNLYENLKSNDDRNKQEMYELKRNAEIANNNLEYLTQEYDAVSAVHSNELNDLQKKHEAEIENFRNKYDTLKTTMETTNEELKFENLRLENQLKELQAKCNNIKRDDDSNDNVTLLELKDNITKLENDNFQLLSAMEDLQDRLNKALRDIVQHELEIDNLKDKISCAEDNLETKKVELSDVKQLLETDQEKIIELSSELAALKSSSNDSHNKKGHSLFAEVDDQRQSMKRLLAAQKQYCDEKTKLYNDSQIQIRQLKREYIAIQKELQICSTTFLKADKFYKDSLYKRIEQLVKDNKKLEEKLNFTEAKLINVSQEKGVTWLDSMLAYCKTETLELSEQLHNCRLQKSAIDELYSKSEQQMARWRFEALKSRCIIKSRESLLEENKILFSNLFNLESFNLRTINIAAENPNVIMPNLNDNDNIVIATGKSNNVVIGSIINSNQLINVKQTKETISNIENKDPIINNNRIKVAAHHHQVKLIEKHQPPLLLPLQEDENFNKYRNIKISDEKVKNLTKYISSESSASLAAAEKINSKRKSILTVRKENLLTYFSPTKSNEHNTNNNDNDNINNNNRFVHFNENTIEKKSEHKKTELKKQTKDSNIVQRIVIKSKKVSK